MRRMIVHARTARRQLARLPLEWKLAVFLLVFSGLFMSGFFDSLIIQVLGFREVDRNIRIAIAAVLAGTVGLMAMAAVALPTSREYRTRKRPAFERTLMIFPLLTPVWVAVGVVNRWPETYIIGDIFLLNIMPLTYYVLTRRPLPQPMSFFRWLYAMMIVLAIVGCVMVFSHNLFGGRSHKLSVDAGLTPLFYILVKANPAPLELALVPIIVTAAILTSKRGTWAGLVFFIVLALILRPGTNRLARIFMALLVVAAGAWTLNEARPDLYGHAVTLLSARVAETREDISDEGGELAAEGGGRMSEILGVYDTIVQRRTPVDWTLGLGLGSIVQARGGRERHHVHSTPAAFLARTGFIGLGLWVVFNAQVVAFLWRHYRRPQREWYRGQLCLWLGLWLSMMLFSLKSQAFWGSALGGIQLAYMYHLCRASEANAPVPARHAPSPARIRRGRPPAMTAEPT